jgi:hypothetical protein
MNADLLKLAGNLESISFSIAPCFHKISSDVNSHVADIPASLVLHVFILTGDTLEIIEYFVSMRPRNVRILPMKWTHQD